MTVYAKCHGPKVDWLTDGKEYEVRSSNGTFFKATDDKGCTFTGRWHETYLGTRWEHIERDDTPESVLNSFETRRETTAAIHDDDGVIAIKITDECGDLSICYGAPGNNVYLNRRHLRAINETVARHDAANTKRTSSPLA